MVLGVKKAGLLFGAWVGREVLDVEIPHPNVRHWSSLYQARVCEYILALINVMG